MKILVQRMGALGDVVLVTPVVRLLALTYPDAEITVATSHVSVFSNSPYCTVTDKPAKDGWDKIITLDLAYEKRPQLHVVLAYLVEAGLQIASYVNGSTDMLRQELFYDRTKLFASDGRPFVAVHAPHSGWKNRTLPERVWREVLEGLKARGCRPVLVGTPNDDLVGADCIRFLTAGDILPQAQLIASCACFIGSDSALLHVAGATETPIVGIYTSVDPAYRMPFRDRCTAIVPELDCRFCQGRRSPPVTDEHCERIPAEQNLCVQCIEPQRILDAVEAMLV